MRNSTEKLAYRAYSLRTNRKCTFAMIGMSLGVSRSTARELVIKYARELQRAHQWDAGLSSRSANLVKNIMRDSTKLNKTELKKRMLDPNSPPIWRTINLGEISFNELCRWVGLEQLIGSYGKRTS
jgi:hypothetical protein